MEIIDVLDNNILVDYNKVYSNFNWDDIEKCLSWYKTGKINAAYEIIDRHAESTKKEKVALIYTDSNVTKKFTFQDMKDNSNRFANLLRRVGVVKQDRVFIFMPRIPEFYFCFLGVLKVGAIVGPLFEAFMEEAVKDRLQDSEANTLVTTYELLQRVPLSELPFLENVIVYTEDENVELEEGYYNLKTEMNKSPVNSSIEWLNKEDPMLIHYTSGSTGKPKGVVHAHGAIIQHYQTGKFVLGLKDIDIYWCTADPGWITGTAYGIFTPWLFGVTNLIRGGRFNFKDWYETIENHSVTIWYSAPTAFRMLMNEGDKAAKTYNLSSLRHILSVGEPLNPEVIRWGLKFYNQRIHDVWWMTETGAIIIANYPYLPIKLGSMGKPIPGIYASIIDNEGNELPPYSIGNLAIKTPWPSMMRKIWNNDEKFKEYFKVPGWYVSGDSAYKDDEGYFWFHGRVDDVINSSGERIGPFEVESKLIEHPAVAEAGVIGKKDPVRGEIVKAFVSLTEGYKPTDELSKDIKLFVKQGLSAHAAPREIEFVKSLPKTRSGKIMRRVLKAWELNLPVGDISTMESD